tara:strand:- start:3693 stop:4745 length:1053 start_codon:yes stop_codon:yes gene_type:complete
MGSQVPTVSVLMPVLNGERFVEGAVNSILLQTFDDFELIIGDDGSTDKTLEIISRLAANDSRIRVIHNSSCQGISKTLNEAASQARGSLIARMDSDDWAHEARLSLQIGVFHQAKDLVLCGSNATHVDEQMQPLFNTVLPVSDWDIRCAALFENPFAHPSVMMRAEPFHRVGGYNEELSTTQDYDLWIRLLAQGEVRNLSESLLKMRRHDQSVSALMHKVQAERTAEVQRDYAKQWIGIYDWHQSRYQNISRHLYRGPDHSVQSVPSGARAVLDSATLTASVKKRYPKRTSNWLHGYILGRCIFSAVRRPVDYEKIVGVIGLVFRNPRMSFWGLVQLAHAALKSHLAWRI